MQSTLVRGLDVGGGRKAAHAGLHLVMHRISAAPARSSQTPQGGSYVQGHVGWDMKSLRVPEIRQQPTANCKIKTSCGHTVGGSRCGTVVWLHSESRQQRNAGAALLDSVRLAVPGPAMRPKNIVRGRVLCSAQAARH